MSSSDSTGSEQAMQTAASRQVSTIRGPLARSSLRLGVLHLEGAAAQVGWLVAHLADLPGSGIIFTLTVSAAQDLAEDGITVNLAAPGLHATDRLIERGVTGRTGDPADFGQVVAFLCSQQAAFINGTAIGVIRSASTWTIVADARSTSRTSRPSSVIRARASSHAAVSRRWVGSNRRSTS